MSQFLEVFKNRNKIWEGLKNKVFKQDHIEAVYKDRISICADCSLYDTQGSGCFMPGTAPCCNDKKDINGVKGCGCSLSLKLRVLSEECPIGKWRAVVTEQEEEMIKDQISKNEA